MKAAISFLILVLSAFKAVDAAGAVCNKAPYNALLFLSNYAPAEAFCSSKYPQPVVTVTAQSTVTVTANTKMRRTLLPQPAKEIRVRGVTKTSTPCTGACKTWSSCSAKGGPALSTLCSCIEHPSTTTVVSKGAHSRRLIQN